jgi:hypothetical protein
MNAYPNAGSENFDHILSGSSDQLPVAVPGQTIVGNAASDEGKDDRHAQATRDSGTAPRRTPLARDRDADRVSEKTARRIAAENPVTNVDNAAERGRRRVGRPSKAEPYREILV